MAISKRVNDLHPRVHYSAEKLEQVLQQLNSIGHGHRFEELVQLCFQEDGQRGTGTQVLDMAVSIMVADVRKGSQLTQHQISSMLSGRAGVPRSKTSAMVGAVQKAYETKGKSLLVKREPKKVVVPQPEKVVSNREQKRRKAATKKRRKTK